MTQSPPILETKQLYKFYGSVAALEDVTLHFADKKIYGVFGRNGAGKTTLLDILALRIFADRGTVTYLGQDIGKAPQIMSQNCCYMPERHTFPGRFKVKKLLGLAKRSFANYNEPYAAKLCQLFELDGEQKYEQLSKGYQSIFRIVIGLAANTAVTIFDEPVLGLDAGARDRFYLELIEAFSKNPRLFIISTHFIEESANLFNDAIIIKNGRVIRQAAVEALLSSLFYLSGNVSQVDAFVQNRTVISDEVVGGLKTAVVVGDLNDEKRLPGLTFSALTMQKLFIHLTNEEGK